MHVVTQCYPSTPTERNRGSYVTPVLSFLNPCHLPPPPPLLASYTHTVMNIQHGLSKQAPPTGWSFSSTQTSSPSAKQPPLSPHSYCQIFFLFFSFPFLFFFFFFFAVLEFELRAYTLSHSTSPFFVTGFFEIGSCELFALAGSNHDPPDLCLLSS
jgi:hypothetical protein